MRRHGGVTRAPDLHADPDEGNAELARESSGHTPVLPDAVRTLLAPRPGETVLDATVGLGGHAALLGAELGSDGLLIGLDVDPENLAVASARLADVPCRVELRQANFRDLRTVLAELGVTGVDVLLADLGISSTQLDDPSRGFSFRSEGRLDMRLDPRLTTTAEELVNRLSERDLGDLFYHNAQETAGRRIAKRICQVRRNARITSTLRLADVVCGALGVDPDSRRSKIHPATRTFMALRMAVNEERSCLDALLEAAPAALNVGGRFGVIAFHSVEDKAVKMDFRQRKTERAYDILTKKPLVANEEERRANPRSRSAKLRVAVRLPEAA